MGAWGEWMGAWKAEAGQADMEQERLSRQAAVFGGETSARMKHLNVLVVGCRGVGVEVAKNLILCNVGSVSIWDPVATRLEDLGANFYLSEADIGKPRAAQCLPQLKSLNPYCKVDVLATAAASLPEEVGMSNVLGTTRGYSAVVVTTLLPRRTLLRLNAEARARGVAFVLAVNHGVTASLFSDFGPQHVVADADGEPAETFAVAAAEVIEVGGVFRVAGAMEGDRVVVLTLASHHSLCDGDNILLDDLRGALEGLNGKTLPTMRCSFISPTEAKIDVHDVGFKEQTKASTADLITNFSKQYEYYKEKSALAGEEKFQTRHITLFNRLCFVLEDGQSIEAWETYVSGGLVSSVKPSVTKSYQSLERSLTYTVIPQMLDQEVSLSGEGCWLQLALAAALRFEEAVGRWPALSSMKDVAQFVELALQESEERRVAQGSCWLQAFDWGLASGSPLEGEALDAVVVKLRRFSLTFEAELTGFCAFLGGAAAQEVIKKTGKFTPVDQWLHHHDPHLLDDTSSGLSGKSASAYQGTRHAFQAAVLGHDFMEKIRSQKVFLVGCGALGCEYMKGLALMGACAGAAGGQLVVTDMDRIEVSNLSRQFLFRQPDVGSPKSTTAARVVKSWSPDLRVDAFDKGVGPTSEDFFNDVFWNSLDLCWNALDNVAARRYTDGRCLWHSLPLLESGTLGTKCNSDVFLPGHTRSYSDGIETDSNETQIAMCTLRSFPFLPLHCIEFAKQAYFADYLEFAPAQYEALRASPQTFFEQLGAMSEAEQLKSLTMVNEFVALQSATRVDFEACIRVAFSRFCKDFITSIRDLVHACDDIEQSTGKPFWTGTKRKPQEASWHPDNLPVEAIEYVYAAANCYAFIWGIPYIRNREAFHRTVVALKLEVPEWSPPSEGKVDSGEQENGPAVDMVAIERLSGELYSLDTASLPECKSHDFEKDDDTNFHVDFLTAAANLRAVNYDIKLSERAHVKVTAGRIIPALATTTAMVCGLVDLEFMKLVKGAHRRDNPTDKFYNCNINLAAGLHAMNAFHPEGPIKKQSRLDAMPAFTIWDKVEVKGELTVKDLVSNLEKRFKCIVDRIFPAGGDGRRCIFDRTEMSKLEWSISWDDDCLTLSPEAAILAAWPQLRMAKQMIERLPPGGARSNFEAQVQSCIATLKSVKESFDARYCGKVSEAYAEAAAPVDGDADAGVYFSSVFEALPCLALQTYVRNAATSEEAEMPIIRYAFRGPAADRPTEDVNVSKAIGAVKGAGNLVDADHPHDNMDSRLGDDAEFGEDAAAFLGSDTLLRVNSDSPVSPSGALVSPPDGLSARMRKLTTALLTKATTQKAHAGESLGQLLARLTHLHLSGKGLTVLGDVVLLSCPVLKVLHLEENHLHTLGRLPKTIEALYLQGNELWEANSWSLDIMNLEVLNLNENRFSVIDGFYKSVMLRDVKLRGQRGEDVVQFSPHTLNVFAQSLRILDLSRNRLTEIYYLEYLGRLDTLDLSDNSLADMALLAPVLSNLPGLRTLRLEGNPLCRTAAGAVARYRDEAILRAPRLAELDGKAVEQREHAFLRELDKRRRKASRSRGPSAPPQLDGTRRGASPRAAGSAGSGAAAELRGRHAAASEGRADVRVASERRSSRAAAAAAQALPRRSGGSPGHAQGPRLPPLPAGERGRGAAASAGPGPARPRPHDM